MGLKEFTLNISNFIKYSFLNCAQSNKTISNIREFGLAIVTCMKLSIAPIKCANNNLKFNVNENIFQCVAHAIVQSGIPNGQYH